MSEAAVSGVGRHIRLERRARFAAVLLAVSTIAGCQGAAGPVGPPGANGTDGTSGTNGSDGASCTLTDNQDGTSTIRCPDGTSITVPSGTPGTSCTVVDNGNGTRTIACSDGTRVVVQDAVVDYAVLTPAELEVARMSAAITSVTVPADGRPVVSIRVSERHGLGVKNLTPGVITWRFGLLKLDSGVNGSANETWVSYLAANATSTASTETGSVAGLTDNGDGSYTYRFNKVITAGPAAAGTVYEPARTHRLVVLVYASGNPFSPINLVVDFVPATGADVTGQHEKFDPAACLECHTQFRAIAGGTGALGTGEFHSGGRYDVRTCVACHNDQRRFTALSSATVGDAAIAADGTWTGNLAVLNGEGVINLPVFIHKLHMGDRLGLKGGTYAGFPTPYELTYPQDVRNCTKCHRNPAPGSPAPLADNWKTQPSRRACGACHDVRSFESPPPPGRTLHSGGAMGTDDFCLVCHAPGGIGGDPALVHAPVSPPNPNSIYQNPGSGVSDTNAAYLAAAGHVPPGARQPSYEVSAVTLDASRHPQVTFRLLLADPNASPPVPPAPVTFPTFGAGATELVPGFVGSPSAYVAYALPQDGVAAPADFNGSGSAYLRSVWNGTATGTNAGILVGPDASGFYTVTLTGLTVPVTATLLTGGIGYTEGLGSAPTFSNNTLPLTQIDLPAYPYTPNASGFGGSGGLIVPAPDVWKVATGFTGRRAIVDNARCRTCHETLGVGPDYHAGQRNDAPTCAFCHRPNLTTSGWSSNGKDAIHAIHAAEKRMVPFGWNAASPVQGFYQVTYPGILNRCEMCHLPGTYDFSLASTTSALPGMLPSTVGQGRYNASPLTNPAGYFRISPYVVSDNQTDYGHGFSASNVNAVLPDGLSGTQNLGGSIVACSPAAPCLCSAVNPCSVDISGPYTVYNLPVSFTQRIGAVTNACNAGTPCTCTTAQPCTGVVKVCSTASPCEAQGTTLVISPIAAACVACHDAPAAVDHMQINGASVWEPRSVAFTKPYKEECLICHGPNRIASISLVHADRTP